MESYGQSNQLTQAEITDTFVKVLSDTYGLKKFLLSQLPNMTYKVKNLHLKMLIIHSGTLLNTQMLRMDSALKQLNTALLPDDSLPADGINFEKYLLKDIYEASIYNDVKFLNHIMLIVGIEVNSFRLLHVLSKRLAKSINELMRFNLSEATKYQKQLLDTYNSYVTTKYK